MKDMYDITLGVISDFLQKDSFSIPELKSSILNNGAPMRVAPAYTVKDYLFELQGDGIIQFQPTMNQFQKVNTPYSQISFSKPPIKL